MSQIEVTDELLYKYVPILDNAMIISLECRVDYNYEFSEEFERKMKRLIWKEEHHWIGDFLRFLKKVAIVFLCIIGVMFAMTMSVEAYRIKFFETVQKIWEDSIIYTYFTDEEDQSFHSREPQYVPEGYVEVSRVSTDDLLSIVYRNDNGDEIAWDQMIVTNGKGNVIDSEYDRQIYEPLEEGTLLISLYEDNSLMAYYEYERYIFVMSAKKISVEEAVKIFNSMN